MISLSGVIHGVLQGPLLLLREGRRPARGGRRSFRQYLLKGQYRAAPCSPGTASHRGAETRASAVGAAHCYCAVGYKLMLLL